MVSVRKHLHNHSLAVSFIFSIIVDLLPTHLLAFYPTTDQYRLMYTIVYLIGIVYTDIQT